MSAASEMRRALEEVYKSIPKEGSLGKFVADKLTLTEESFDTHAQLVDLANSVIQFLSREYGEQLPGKREDVERLIAKAQQALATI